MTEVNLPFDISPYDCPEHMALDLRQIAQNFDDRVGYVTMDGDIIRRAASHFDGLPKDATYEESRLALIEKQKK